MRERLRAENRQPLFSFRFSDKRFPKRHGNEHRKFERRRRAWVNRSGGPIHPLDACYRIIRWTLAIGGHLFGGAGMLCWYFGFWHPEAAVYAIVCLVIATAAEYARRVTP